MQLWEAATANRTVGKRRGIGELPELEKLVAF